MGDGSRRRMRSVSVVIGVTAVAAAAMSGCTSNPDYEAVCVDESNERVDDDLCDDDQYSSYGSGYHWYYYSGGSRVPSVGSRVSGGSTVKPSSRDSYSDPDSSSRDSGGFGGRSGGVSS